MVISDSAVSMFSSIKESEKVGRGEGGGNIEGEGGDGLKNMLLIPFLGIFGNSKKTEVVLVVVVVVVVMIRFEREEGGYI